MLVRTDKQVIAAMAKAIKQIDAIKEKPVSGMDQFYINTARDLLLKVIHSNGYEMSEETYRVKKILKK